MPGLNENRERNQTMCFRTTIDERRVIEARMKASGIPKCEFYRNSLINQKIIITLGKYESDRLALEISKLKKQMESCNMIDNEGLINSLKDALALFTELNRIISYQKENASE